MSKRSKSTSYHTLGAPLRGAGVIVERQHDAYRPDHKPPEPTVCPECQAAFHAGRWQWIEAPAGAHEELCPACRRIRDEFPAGYLTIGGEFYRQHRDELMQLVKHRAEHVKSEHPLQRIMTTEDTADGVLITTTDIHLARGLGEVLHHAHQGELEFHYEDAQNLLRVSWTR